MKYRRYPKYRQLGHPFLRELPQHWASRQLRLCAAIPNGQVDPCDNRYCDLPLVGPEHIQTGTGRLSGVESAAAQGAISGKYAFSKDDLLFSKIRPELRKACHPRFPGLCSADVYPLRPAPDMDAGYLLHQLLSEAFSQEVILDSGRVAMPKVNRPTLGRIRLVVPPRDEQAAIAAFLDAKTAEIDALIAKNERLMVLLQEKRTAVIAQLVTQGLDSSVPMKASGVPWAPAIPRHWQTTPAWAHLRPVKEQGFSGLPLLSVYRDYGVILKSSREDNYNRAGEDLAVYQRVQHGDVVMNKMKAWQGSVAVSDLTGIVSPDYQVLRRTSGAFETGYLHLLLRSAPYVSEYAARAYGVRPDQWRLMFREFRTIPLLMPPIPEQRRIANRVHEIVDRAAQLVGVLRAQLGRLREYRSALISAAVTGTIDVRHYPAEVPCQ